MERHLIDYIRRPEMLDAQATAHLRDIVQKYPYFHAARILLLKALYQQHDPTFDQELRRTAILVPSRESLFHLIEEKNYMPESNKRQSIAAKSRTEEDTDRTGSLIDNFLSGLPLEENTPRRSHPVDATVDYIGYLLQQGGAQEDEGNVSMHGGDLIDNFLQNESGKIKLKDTEDETQPEVDQEADTSTSTEIFTETLAQIYIKQGNFERAIEIIKRLSLKYPKKNRYFADQIRFMEKILINNKNK